MSSVPAADAFEVGGLVLLSGLGRDDLAEHWIARDPVHGSLVHAVRLSAITLADAEATAAFLDHHYALSGVEHPGIVRAIETRRDDSSVLAVLELVEGVTLRELIDASSGERLALGVVSRIVHDVASALAALESEGIVHADLTPRSIRLLPAGNAVIVPSGLASAVCRLGEAAPPARLAYKAPEQLATHASDARSDVFSLAVCAWEALSGRFPFSGDRSAIEGVPAAVVSVLERALDAEPERRPGSARELSKALLEAAGERPASRFELGELIGLRGAEALSRLRAEIEMATPSEDELIAEPIAKPAPIIDPNADLFEDTQPSLAKRRAREQARQRRRRWAILAALAVAGVVAGVAFGIGRAPNTTSLPAAAETTPPAPAPSPSARAELAVSLEREPAPPPIAESGQPPAAAPEPGPAPATPAAAPAKAKPRPKRPPAPARSYEIPAGI